MNIKLPVFLCEKLSELNNDIYFELKRYRNGYKSKYIEDDEGWSYYANCYIVCANIILKECYEANTCESKVIEEYIKLYLNSSERI